MNYIQLDNFNGELSIVCKDDGSGEHLVFDTLQEAKDTLAENCQNGQIIPLDVNIIDLLKNCSEFVGMAYDEDLIDEELTAELDKILDSK